MTSAVSSIRRGTSQALLVVEAAGDATSGELEVDGAEEFVAGSWSFVQSGCLPVTSVGVVPPLLVELLPLLPDLLVGTGVGVVWGSGVLLASMVGVVVICQFAEPSGMRA